jgi:hypothetical protein
VFGSPPKRTHDLSLASVSSSKLTGTKKGHRGLACRERAHALRLRRQVERNRGRPALLTVALLAALNAPLLIQAWLLLSGLRAAHA